MEGEQQLHIRRIHEKPGGIPVFMLHGSMEDGRIFYTLNNKGLGPFLARQGYDVFVPDMRGRGKSHPPVSRTSRYGQTGVINEEIPFMLEKIKEVTGQASMHWVSHSWGGVMQLSYMARYGSEGILSLVTLGSKRQLTVKGLNRFYMIEFGWNGIGKLAVKILGYLPGKQLGMGAGSETGPMFHGISKWIKGGSNWVDDENGFDYSTALQQIAVPPALYFAGANDPVLGHPQDVKLLMEEAGGTGRKFELLATENGYSKDYGHIDMLTDPGARKEVYPVALDWMRMAEKGVKD